MALPLTPIRFLYRAADLFSDSPAIVCGAQTFTYGDFTNRTERLASALRRAGIDPETGSLSSA